MSAFDAIKRAPRWTWYIAGGVGLGSIAIRLYQNRDAEDAAVASGDGATAGDYGTGTTTPATTGSSPPGVIVPPIIMGNDGGSASDLGAAFAGLVGGTIDDLTQLAGRSIDAQYASNQQWIGAVQESNTSWVGSFGAANQQWIGALAQAGSAPQPVAQNPTPVVVNVAPAPAPAVAAPVKGTPAAPAGYPHKSARGWYKCEKQKNGTYLHIYSTGERIGGNKQC
jgi:hypothetical protein